MNKGASHPYTPSVVEDQALSALDDPPESGPEASSRNPVRGVAGDPSASPPRAARARPRSDPATTGRRAIVGLSLGALVVGVLCLLDYLPALYAAVVIAHVWIAYRWRRRARTSVPDAVRVSPTPMGVMVLALLWVLLLFAVFLPSSSFRLLACLLFACAALGWPLSAANVARVSVVRRIAPRARVDVKTALEFIATNPTSRPAETLRLEDDLGLATRPQSLEIGLDTVPSHGEGTARVSVTFQRRGWRRLRPVRVSSTYPLGIFAATRDTDAPAEVLVHPREGVPTPALLDRLRGRSREAARTRAVAAGPDEFHGLREFRDGDDPRRIHWATSARRGAPTFVLRREEPARRVIVALAACRSKDRAGDAAFERAVSAAAGILRASLRAGCRPTLVLSATSRGVQRGTLSVHRDGELLRALDALAVVKADGNRDPHAAFGADPGRYERATLVWISSTPEGAHEIPGTAEGVRVADRIRLRADDPSFSRFVTLPMRGD